MKDHFIIRFINADDCFLYLNKERRQDFIKDDSDKRCIKVKYGEEFCNFVYASLNDNFNNDIDDECIGINSTYAATLGLNEGQEVLLQKQCPPQLTKVYVRILDVSQDMEYECLGDLLMEKVRIVTLDHIIPIALYSHCNKTLLMHICKLEPKNDFGELVRGTEVIILDSPDSSVLNEDTCLQSSPENYAVNTKNNNGIETSEGSQDSRSGWFPVPRSLTGLVLKMTQKMTTNEYGNSARYVNRNNPGTIYQSKTLKYFIAGPTFAYKSKMPKQLRDKCFFPKNFVVNETTSNQPHDSFCKILNMSQGLKDAFNTFSFTNNFMYWYVNSFGDRSSDVLCCPDFVMRGLGMKIGSVMGVEEIKHTQDLLNEMKFYKDKERNIEEPVFPAGIEKIYKKVIKTVGDNMRCNQKINILIIGSAGMGKTFLLNSLAKHFAEVFLHCVKIDCKSLRKLKVSDISKIFSKKLSECCKYQPSVLLIDDLDAFIIEATEGDHYSSMYREYIGNSIISLLSSYQKVNDIHFIATGSYASKFKTISTDHGPLIFQSIHEIMELDPEERSFMLKHLISKEYPKYEVDDNTFIDDIKDRMKSYNIQDLCDFLDIVVLNCHSRTDTDKTKLIKSDFEAALSEKVPLSLYGVNLHNSPATRWEDIGGMEETKEMLNEMFSWPLKYQEVYKSCPLRLQCGVLLYGAPGTGKTLIAGAVASECGLNFISIKGPEILSKYVGASEQGIRDLFLRAKKAKPCLLFFDEFDSLASRRGSSNTDVNDRVVNQLLTELDGVEELTGVYILGATSRPDLLDPALLRPGRIDKTVYCTLPNEKERSSILRALSKRLKSADDMDLESIASKTDGYTGADLQAILYAAQSAMVKEAEKDRNGSDQKLILKQSHLLTGLAEIKPSLSDEDQLKYNMIYDNFTQCRTGGVVKQPQDTQMKVMYA